LHIFYNICKMVVKGGSLIIGIFCRVFTYSVKV
jgi:hypothetical protein